MSLKDELKEWFEEYPSLKDHGWTDGEFQQLTDAQWEWLQDQLGPAQEKLMNDVEVARRRANEAEKERDIVANELARLLAADPTSA